MLQGARMTPWNRNTYTIFIDNDVIYSKWGREVFSPLMEGGEGFAKNN